MDEKKCNYYCYQNTRKLPKKMINKSKNIKIIIFDMDGVLADTVSSWKYVHDFLKTDNEKSVDDYMNGKIDYKEFIRRDVSLWLEKNDKLSIKTIEKILSNIPIMKGTKETFKAIKEMGLKTAIVSGGIDILSDRIAKKYDIDYSYANRITTDKMGFIDGDGEVIVDLMYKDKNIYDIARKEKIEPENIASVGNSCLDIPMFQVSGLSIAFNPSDECVREYADFVIEGKNLIKILPIIKENIEKK